MSDCFNLVEAEWIPVLSTDGRFKQMGIRKALTEAGAISQIAAPNPMDRVALLRFLLAVLYWCQGNPPDDGGMNRLLATGIPAEWLAKLDQRKDCFDLLGDGRRFYQDPNARRQRAATDLLQEIPTGNNFRHFRHSTDYVNGLCLSCCAMGLLRLPLFSVSGLPDLKSGINGSPPIYVLAMGRSLLETLCLNWTASDSPGIPAWVQAAKQPEHEGAVPLLAGLTMLARRVWLHDPAPPGGLCVSCGVRQDKLIVTCRFQTAGTLENETWRDPHVVYVEKPKVGRKGLRAPDPTKAFFRMDKPWSQLLAGICSSPPSRSQTVSRRLLIVGFATDKAKNIDVWERTWDIPPANGLSEGVAERLDAWHDAGGKLFVRLKPPQSKGDGTECFVSVVAVRPHVEARVSANAGELLCRPDAAWRKAADEYAHMLPVVAKSLAPGFTTRAVQRRNQIARAFPDMAAKAPAAPAGGKAKKGGG